MQHEQALLGPAARREALRKRLHRKEQQAKARFSVTSRPPPDRAPHAHDDGELQRDSDDNDHALETYEDNIDGPAVEPGDVAAELNARVIEGARESVQRALERERRDEEYHEEKALRVERNAELSRLAIESEGVQFVKEIHEGRVLFHGTGIPGKDALHNQMENADAEVDLLVDSHQEWALRSPELQEGLEALTPRSRQLRRDRDSELDATMLVAQGRIEKKRNFLLRVQRADREANEAHDEAEKIAAEAQELLEKLRKQHNVLSFEARAKTRRVMLAKQAEASALRKTADAAKEDAKQLKRHMIERGLAPDSFVSAATNAQTSPNLAKTKLPALGADSRAPHTEVGHLTEHGASQADDPDPPSTPDPQDWDYHLREGLKMSHLELMDSSTRRQHRMADAEAALSRQQEQELAQIKNRVRLARKAQHEARKSASTAGRPPSQSSEMSISTAASSESLVSEMGNIDEKEGSSKRSAAADNKDDNDDDERLDATDFVAAAMSAANVSHQNRKVLVSQADLDASTVRGMTLETAPPFCNEWGFKQRCTRAQCQGRHFYVSPKEAHEWQMRRAAVDAGLEMGVLDAIASREQLIASARSEAEACSRKFQSHLSGFVQTEDVGSLLYLLNRLRVASVRVVEALVKWRRGGETRLSAAEGAAETFAESFLKPRGWVVKIGFMGEQLYPGSKAFRSKVKRFSRDEDVNGKKALRFRYVGIYETREQALRAYEDEIKRLMAKEMCGPENFPKPKTIIRACGKHFAVESEMGVPNTRCEICFANSFNHFGKYSPSYMWNGQNYLLKMLHDTNFLEDIELLRLFFKEEFATGKLSFRGNPFLLAADIQNGERRELRVRKVRSESALAGDTTTKQAAATFGVPTDAVVVHPNQCIEWHGHMSRGPQIAVGKQRAYISLHVTSRHLVDEFARKYEAKHFEVVDMRRIRAAQAVLSEEKDLARYMYESRLDAKAKATQLLLAAEKQARREERARRRENGEEVESSSENDSSEESSSGEDNTQFLGKGPAAVGKKHGSSRKKKPIVYRTYKTPDVLSKEEIADLSNGAARRRRAPRYNPQTQAERLSESRLHTAYFWERGEYIAVQQVRHDLWGKKPGVWATGDPGTTFEGMQVRGEHRKHFDFNRKLKEQGKALVARRKRIQRRLAKSLRRGDACNPETIMQLVQLGREAQGSLLLMDCDTAELFLQKWQQRTRAAGIIQRNLRAAFARAFCTDLRVRIAANAELELRRGRNAVKLARRFTRKVVRKSVHRAKQRMKRPFLTEAVEYEGETVLVSIHDAHKLDRFTRSKATLLEPCFACRGLTTRTRERRDLAWLSVRGEPCVPGNVESCDRGIVKLERIFHAGAGNGPCYCRRAHASHGRLLFEAYFPATSQTTCGVFRFASLLRGLRRVDAGVAQQAHRAARKAADILLQHGASAARLLPNVGERTVVPSTYACRKKRELRLRLVQLMYLLQEFDRRDRHCQRLWKGTQGLFRGVKQRARVAQENLMWREKAHVQASEHLHNAHATMLAAQVHKHAMVQACDTALNFSKRQIELYEDLSLSTNQQAWDPLENANNAIYIQRKWQATKAVDLAIHIRNLAIHRAFEASIEYATSKDHADQTASLLRSTQCEIVPTIELIQKDTRAVRDLLHASLRAIVQISIRKLVAIKQGRQSRAGPLVRKWCLLERQPRHLRATTNHNTLFRQGRMIVSPPFVGHVKESFRAIIQVFELDAPSHPRVPALPPSWVRSKFTHSQGIEGFDPHVALAGPIFGGPQHKPTVEEAMCMLVRDRSAWENSLAHQWSISFDVEDAIVQPPYVGTIRVSVYDASAGRATEWELDPIDLRLLLVEPHAGLPGAPIPEVFSYAHVQRLLLASRDANGMLTHQSMRKAIDALRRKVVGRLVQLVHLNVIDGGLRLGKLYFQRLRRKLFNSLFPTQWWKDLCRGRSSLQGHMILGGTHMIAGAPASVTVFENQGDLTVRVCWSRARVLADGRRIKRCRTTLHDESIRLMFQESGDLESFVLWKQCVKCNTYPRQVIEEILRNLTLDGAVRRGLCESGNEQRHASLDGECDDRVRMTRAQSPSRQGPAYTGKERFVLAGKPLRTRFPFLPLGDAREASYRDPLKLVTNTRALYELVHREVLFISGLHLVVSGRMRTDGDILIEAAKFDQTVLSIRLSKPRVRDLVEKAGLAHLLERQRAKELFATLFALLAVRTATRPPHATREHPFFAKFCKMLQVGVPRGAVAHAILHDKDLKASVVDTMHVVLDADHSMQPPDRFRLGPRSYQCLILSQARPDEHFRLLHRGVTCVRGNVSVSMDVLERNRNLWLRMRRETQREKDTRVCCTEQAAMALEDDLAKTAQEQTTLYLEENAHVMVQAPHMDKIYEERTRLANRIAGLRHARRSRLTGALDGLRLDASARKILWPSSTVMKRYALRSASPKSWKRATVEAVRRIDGIGCVLRCWQGPSGDALVQVRVPSWNHISSHTIDLDVVSEECWQEAEDLRTLARGDAHETMARAEVSRSVASLSQTLLRGVSRKIGPFRIRYDPIEERVFLQTQTGAEFALPIEGPSLPASNTKMIVADESLTNSDEGMIETTAENEDAALIRRSSLKSSSSIDAGIEVFAQSDAHAKTESEVQEAARYASQEGQFDVAKDDWKMERELLARYTAAAARTSSGDTIMRELLDPSARVGLGPVTGGATPESDPDAEILVKHSVTLPADMLDILACTKRSDVPFLAHAEAESASEMQRLVTWLASRTRFVLRGAENGKDDAVSFDREFLRHGRLLRCVGQSSQRLGSILRATLSDQGDLLTVASFDRVRGEWTPQVSLELKRGQPVTRGSAIHAFVNLIPQHEGVEAIASEAQDSLLEPRRMQELLRKLLGRCRALNNGNVLLDLNAFELRIYEAMRARDRAAACLVEDERCARASLEEACRELCSGERKRHAADLSERADQFARSQDICVAAREWPAMSQEDADAHAIRAYLACESWRLTPIERAFRRFDSNRDDGLDPGEFRALAFSIGHVLTAEEATEALSLIDKDGNGTISLRELSLWALCAAPSKEKDLKFRRLQFELRVAASRARVRSVAERARTTVAGIAALSAPREPGVAESTVSHKEKK